MGVAKFNVPDGSGSSPILAAGRVIVTRDGPPHLQMLALDANTGKLVWTTKLEAAKSPGPKVAHATPVLYSDGNGGNEQVILKRAGFVSGFALSDGQLLWFDRDRDGVLDQAEYEAVKDFGSTPCSPGRSHAMFRTSARLSSIKAESTW